MPTICETALHWLWTVRTGHAAPATSVRACSGASSLRSLRSPLTRARPALRAPVTRQLPERRRHDCQHALNCRIRSINEGRSTENVNRIVRRAQLRMTEAHRTEKWWTPEQLRLVEDTARSWVRTTFSPSDMLLIRRQPGEGSMGRRARPGEQPGPD
jgi:hypothetical protein